MNRSNYEHTAHPAEFQALAERVQVLLRELAAISSDAGEIQGEGEDGESMYWVDVIELARMTLARVLASPEARQREIARALAGMTGCGRNAAINAFMSCVWADRITGGHMNPGETALEIPERAA